MLPTTFISEKPYAHDYVPALLVLPTDVDDRQEAIKAFSQDVLNRSLQLNVEYRYVSWVPVRFVLGNDMPKVRLHMY